MKNLIALLLTFALVLSLSACGQKTVETVPAAEQSVAAEMSLDVPTAGGWQRPASPAVPDEVKALLDKALEQMDGAVYTPVAYLGSQVVAGTNHALLCRTAPVVPDAIETWCLVYLYEDLEGNVEMTEVKDSLSSTNLPNENVSGGWEQPASPEVTEEARTALEKAMEGFAGAEYNPVALLSTQVVAGMNYCILCERTVTAPDAETDYALVYVYADLEGNAELTQIVDFDGTTQMSPSNGEEG